jgi:hypothetical protein
MYKMILSGVLEQYYEIPRENSWMIAAAEKNLPIVVPGWEDSTMGNIFASYCIKGDLKFSTMKSGIEYMAYLADWYTKNSDGKGVGSFKLGEELPEIFQSVWCRCFIRIWKCTIFLSGVISVRFLILQHLTVHILEQFRMKKSLGVNWISQHQNLLLKVMLPSVHL